MQTFVFLAVPPVLTKVANIGNLVKARTYAYPRRTLVALLSENRDLTSAQVDRAAAFIGACLRLNPADRPSAGELRRHPWLVDAFMGCMHD